MKYVTRRVHRRWRVFCLWGPNGQHSEEEVFVGFDKAQADLVRDALNTYLRARPKEQAPRIAPLRRLA